MVLSAGMAIPVGAALAAIGFWLFEKKLFAAKAAPTDSRW
jgi:hypothetical protein